MSTPTSFKIENRLQSETGASLFEYALLVAMIALVAYAGAMNLFIDTALSMDRSRTVIVGAVGGISAR